MADEITLTCDRMVHGGDALGRHQGQAVFVAGAIAGERVRARIVARRRGYLRAAVVAVEEESEARTTPPCPAFPACGGCQWQHIGYPDQLRFKRQVVVDQLRRIGHLPEAEPLVLETVASPMAWGYRNHCRFHQVGQGGWGFRSPGGERVVPIDGCGLAMAPIAAWLASMQGRPGPPQVAVRSLGGELSTSLAPRPLVAEVAGARLRVSPGSFFQVNTPLLPTLVEQVVARLAPAGGERVVDAYGGVGLFGRLLAERAASVVVVETGPAAVADARVNLAALANAEVVAGRAEQVVGTLSGRIDALVVDPPRAGCAPPLLEALAHRRVARLVYVSCDPATLARDAARLTALGYRLQELQPVDLFPQTFHVETVSTWTWR